MAIDDTDTDRRRFLTAATSVVGGVGVAFAAVPFLASFQPSDRAKAIGAPIEIDISKIEPGQLIKDKWRGKPVWVLRRTQESLDALSRLAESGELRDPESEQDQQPAYAANEYRSIKPEYLVVVGICTHLGCSPTYVKSDGEEHGLGPDWQGGFFCPCHGSRFDLAGRVYKNVPAPTNLVVPPYQFVSDSLLVVGTDQETA